MLDGLHFDIFHLFEVALRLTKKEKSLAVPQWNAEFNSARLRIMRFNMSGICVTFNCDF